MNDNLNSQRLFLIFLAMALAAVVRCNERHTLNAKEIEKKLEYWVDESKSIKDTTQLIKYVDSLVGLPKIESHGFYKAACIFLRLEDFEKALHYSTKYIPYDATTRYSYSALRYECFRNLKNVDSSFVYAKGLIELNGDTSVALFAMTQVAIECELWPLTLELCDSALALNEFVTQQDKLAFYQKKAISLERLGRIKESCECCKQFVPDYWETLKDNMCKEY
jgi:tetratricopeptide (TPR) repeat protein